MPIDETLKLRGRTEKLLWLRVQSQNAGVSADEAAQRADDAVRHWRKSRRTD